MCSVYYITQRIKINGYFHALFLFNGHKPKRSDYSYQINDASDIKTATHYEELVLKKQTNKRFKNILLGERHVFFL